MYQPSYWALVFCVGGYAVATHLLTTVLGISFFGSIPEVVFYTALFLMVILLVGMFISIGRKVLSPASGEGG